MPSEKRSVMCIACGHGMPWDDWLKHKKGKKHRGKVEKSGGDIETVNKAVENGAVEEEKEQSAAMEEDVRSVMFKGSRVGGRTKYLSSNQEDDTAVGHEYVNSKAEWTFDGAYIREKATGKYLTTGEPNDTLTTKTTLAVSKPMTPFVVTRHDDATVSIHHPTEGTLSLVPNSGAIYKVPAVFHKAPRDDLSRWSVVSPRKIPKGDVLYRGKVKLYSSENATGFIECNETYAIYGRDIYIDHGFGDLVAAVKERDGITDDVDAEKPPASLLLWKVVDFEVSVDEDRGFPRAVNLRLSTREATAAYRKNEEERRRLKAIVRDEK
eukprot:TRINITY_DN46480_c0_g1_i1.p1 TRINITY_DN46480_c0_g1~~TRINITY_DN46480_c0_g1_i1.p1  ORF type:complete len:323 (+),score=52.32 TRINITY_DN46480_c0_g1_i1:63-1031(+)